MISRKQNKFMRLKEYKWAKKEIKAFNADCKKSEKFSFLQKRNKTALKLFKVVCKATYGTFTVAPTFNDLVEGVPLTPITDDNAEWKEVENNKWQSQRYPSLFKTIKKDGSIVYTDKNRKKWKLGDDRILDDLFPISLPYLPSSTKKFYVEVETWECLDGKSTVCWIQYVITPEMKYIPINKYYYDVDGERREITKEEFDERRKW